MTKKKKSLVLSVIVISLLLAISLAAMLTLLLTRDEGAVAVVRIDGKKVAEYRLDTDGEYPLNGGTNILVIKGGEAYMKYADCPDKTCTHVGKIKYNNQSIICLPNRISVIIENGTDGADFVTG